MAGLVKRQCVVLRGLGQSARADKFDDLLGQPDRVHQLDHRRLIETELTGVLPPVLLDPFGGAKEADDGVLALGSLISSALCGLNVGRPCAWSGAGPAACYRRRR
jgi:hypothetical protein